MMRTSKSGHWSGATLWHSGGGKKAWFRASGEQVNAKPDAMFARRTLGRNLTGGGTRDPYDHGVPLGAPRDRAVAVRTDGWRLGGAAAHRQFRLGRHHLDLRSRAGWRGKCAVADRGRRA